jgi:amino acid transporter
MNAPPPNPPAGSPRELRRILGVWDAAALIIGITIGSGIFATPPLVADHLPGTGPMLMVWMLGGLLALCGALCYAELAAMFPETGGQFVFLREGYGRLPAFSYGWSALLVTYPASIAAVSVVFTAYLARLVPIDDAYRPAVAAGLCLLIAVLNILGVRLGAWTLKIFTGSKVLAIATIIVVGFLAGKGSWDNLNPMWLEPPNGLSAAMVALALVSVLWTYEGWSDGPTLAGEMQNPDRDMTRALLLATGGVVVIYLFTNLAYIYVLGVDGVRSTDSVAVDVAAAIFGRSGHLFVTLLVLVSTAGSLVGMTMAGSRVFFAMGRERLFLEWVGRVHPRFGTPAVALGTLGVIGAVYALLGTFEKIIGYFVFVSTIWLVFVVASVLKHRIRRPRAKRPFRIPLYPIPPLIYLGVAVGLLYKLLKENTRDALIGTGIVLASIPVFFIWERFRVRREHCL